MAKSNAKKYDARRKVLKVIASCVTLDQLQVACRVVDNFAKNHEPTVSIYGGGGYFCPGKFVQELTHSLHSKRDELSTDETIHEDIDWWAEATDQPITLDGIPTTQRYHP